MTKKRLDVILTEQALAPSREKAKAMVMSGIVYVDGQKEDKPGTPLDPQKVRIEVRGGVLPYVSRGGLKLEKALQVFPVSPSGKVCMDIGASTGGFTDCMLQNGASFVYAIDVGYGQLDWRLRSDPRVACMEKTNFRYLKPEDIRGEEPSFAACDVSFISLSRILPPAAAILPSGAQMVCLIKPQFEAGRDKVGHRGVVRDPAVHCEVIERAAGLAQEEGFCLLGLDFSPIRGPEGNIEYLMALERLPHGPGVMGEPAEPSEEAPADDRRTPASGEVSLRKRIVSLVERSHAAFERAGK